MSTLLTATGFTIWVQVLPPEIAARCEGTIGGWCGRMLLQEEIPAKARTPRSSVFYELIE